MEIPTKEDLRTLIESQDGLHVSLFMPSNRTGIDAQQDKVRLKNMLRDVEENLAETGARAPDIKQLLEPGWELLENSQFWRHLGDGLALFLAPGFVRPYRVPQSLTQRAVLNRRFYVKPLLPLLSNDGRFYVLALSQNQVRLLEGTRHTVKEVDTQDMPASLADALRYDDKEEWNLQFHTDTQPSKIPGERAAIYFGTGTDEPDPKEDILRYFQQINEGVYDLLKNRREVLVLAGVEYLHPIYRAANSYGCLLEQGINGNPEGLSPQELHERAWQIVQPLFSKPQADAAARYEALAGSGSPLASGALDTVLAAAYYGRVDTLFLAAIHESWGRFDPNTGKVTSHQQVQPGDEELLDLAAVHTFLNGGTVYAVDAAEVPGGGPLAAIFRY